MTPDRDAIAAAFDVRAADYRRSEWHRLAAERLVALVRPSPRDRVLDAGTGTGFAALAAALAVGPAGRVLGIDLSGGMLREARAACDRAALATVELRQGDATSLPDQASGSFDVVLCAAGLLYMPVVDALAEWRRLLKPGGTVGFSGMASGWPLPGRLFRACAAAHGFALEDPSEPLGSEGRCEAALTAAGFIPVRVARETVPFSPADLARAWDANLRSANHAPVLDLPTDQLDRLRAAFEAAMATAERTDPDALARAEILYAVGER